MPTDPFPSCPTAQGMVAKSVTGPEAGWARPLGVENWQAKAVLHRKHKLSSSEVKAKSREGGCVEPITSVTQRERGEPGTFPVLTLLVYLLNQELLLMKINLD